jgi:hypothetical protein
VKLSRLSCDLYCRLFPCAEAEEQLLNAKIILRSYNEALARRDPAKSARTAVAAAGAHRQSLLWLYLEL